jgi:hypothetical protein
VLGPLAKLSWRPFEEAREFVRTLGLKSGSEWQEFCESNLLEIGTLPADIAANPNITCASKGWSGMGDWLGTDRTRVSKSPKRKS